MIQAVLVCWRQVSARRAIQWRTWVLAATSWVADGACGFSGVRGPSVGARRGRGEKGGQGTDTGGPSEGRTCGCPRASVATATGVRVGQR